MFEITIFLNFICDTKYKLKFGILLQESKGLYELFVIMLLDQ